MKKIIRWLLIGLDVLLLLISFACIIYGIINKDMSLSVSLGTGCSIGFVVVYMIISLIYFTENR